MTALAWIGAPVLVALVFGGGYLVGRRSAAQRAVDRLQRRELRRPLVNPQAAADRAEAGDG